MGAIINNVQSFGDLMLPSVEVDRLFTEADFPFNMNLQSAGDGQLVYDFSHNDINYVLVWTEGSIIAGLPDEEGSLGYPLVVSSNDEEEMAGAEYFAETLGGYIAAAENWKTVSQMQVVRDFPEHFSMSYKGNGVIIQDEGFRTMLLMDGDTFALLHMEPDADLVGDQEFENALDIPLHYLDPVEVHPAMAYSFLGYMADHLGVGELDDLLKLFGPVLSKTAQ